VASSPPHYHHNHNSKHDLIDYIGILPCCDAYLPLAGSLLPIPRRYVYLDWQIPRQRIKGEDIRVLEGQKGQSYVKGVTVCLSPQKRGILCKEEIGKVGNGGEEVMEAFRLGKSKIPGMMLLWKRVWNTGTQV
jgi:hypothetical protein